MLCNNLITIDVYYHDENCFMPEPYCKALLDAEEKLKAFAPVYSVSKLMVDDGYKSYTLASFDTEQEAVDFMLNYTGNGDALHLNHGDDLIAYADLWCHEIVVTYVPVIHISPCDCSSDELPF